jgi:hypothetical protein
MSQVSVFHAESTAITYTTKKGDLATITAEGALFKGGLALAALKDLSVESAMAKATIGRYAPAVDIMGAAFPSVDKAGNMYLVGGPAANKTNFVAHCHAVLNFKPKAGKELTKKQHAAAVLARAYLKWHDAAEAEKTAKLETVERVS